MLRQLLKKLVFQKSYLKPENQLINKDFAYYLNQIILRKAQITLILKNKEPAIKDGFWQLFSTFE